MSNVVPISKTAGIELLPGSVPGVMRVSVLDTEAKQQLSWDRYVRIRAAARAIQEVQSAGEGSSECSDVSVLDVGGFDGSLAFFLEGCMLDLTDPATTGADFFDVEVEPHSYDVVAAIDVLEHVIPERRSKFLEKLARASRRLIVLNYPHSQTKKAQEIVFKATSNSLVKEHVEWALPDDRWVVGQISQHGYRCEVIPHGSLAVWLGQYVLLNAAPEKAAIINNYLLDHCADEPFTSPLYSMVVCRRQVL